MDIPDKKVGSMDPVTMAKKTPRPDDVRTCAIFAACVTAFSVAVGYSVAHALALDPFHVACWEFSSFMPCDQLTDAVEVEVNAIWLVMLSCVPVLAAWTVLVLRFPSRRRWVRLALACLALALTIVSHCMYATAACLILVAHLGDLFFQICWIVGIFFYAVTGPFKFLALLLREE